MAHLIELPLLQEYFQNQHQGLHWRQGVHEVTHKASCNWPIGHIKADVKVHIALFFNELDDGDFGFRHHLQLIAGSLLGRGESELCIHAKSQCPLTG